MVHVMAADIVGNENEAYDNLKEILRKESCSYEINATKDLGDGYSRVEFSVTPVGISFTAHELQYRLVSNDVVDAVSIIGTG